MTQVRWGVIGATGIADSRTIPEGIIPAENSELAAIMTRKEDDVQRLSDKYDGVPGFTDHEQMLDEADIDACYIATPPHLHLEQVQACAQRGIHVFCEKPLDISVQGAEKALAACEEAGVELGIGFMMPFHHLAVEARRIVDDGTLGQIVSARAQFGFDYPPMADAFRQVKKLHRGGVFMDVGNHAAGLLEHIMDSRVEAAMAMTDNVIHEYEGVEDTAVALMRFDNKAIGIVDTFFNTDAARNLVEITGSECTLVAQGVLGQTPGGTLWVYRPIQEEYIRIYSDGRNMYREEIYNFAQAVITDMPPMIDGAEGVWSQRVVEAVYQSAETGQMVRPADV